MSSGKPYVRRYNNRAIQKLESFGTGPDADYIETYICSNDEGDIWLEEIEREKGLVTNTRITYLIKSFERQRKELEEFASKV